jgi:TPR repeat protein/CHAT domain-containing protein
MLRRALVLLSLILTLTLGAADLRAQSLEHECDRLAASPSDSNRNRSSAGIPFEDLNPNAAIAACEEAVRSYPTIIRFRYQLARALQKAQRFGEAARQYEPLAMSGYAAAAHNLGQLLLDGTGVSKDVDKAIQFYREAAQAGMALSQFQLGLIFADGYYVDRDPTLAAKWYEKAADQGHAIAMNNLADMYLNGDYVTNDNGVAQDYKKALELYRKSAEQGYAVAQANVGMMYADGLGVDQDYSEAAKWYGLAAEQGNAWAQDKLGTLYRNGTGVVQDYNKALELYRKSAEQGHDWGQSNIGVMYKHGLGVKVDPSEAAKWYGLAADQGNAWAQNELGDLYRDGTSPVQDYKKALELYRKSAEQGYAVAQADVGLMYANGLGIDQDYSEAAKWYGLAADQGNAWAQDRLGDLYKDGAGVAQDYKKALELYRKSAEQGYAVAQADVGLMYANGLGVDQDYAEAAKWYGLAADRGNALAQNRLGFLFQNGRGVAQDYNKAMSLYRKSAAQGHAVAQGNVGFMYEGGLGVEADYFEAAKWYGLAADQGNAWAQNKLGFLFQNGQGVPQDYDQAMSLYRKSAAQGSAEAQNNIGWMYAHGLGVEMNHEEAAKWYGLAADQGNTWAQNKLGFLFQNGQGVPQDYDKAMSLYRKSAAQGSAEAQNNIGWMYAHGLGVEVNHEEAARWYSAAADQSSDANSGFAMAQLGWMREKGLGVPRDNLKAYMWYRLAVEAGHDPALLRLGDISQNNLSDYYDSDAGRSVPLDERIATDEFLTQHGEMAKKAASRDKYQSLAEAADWFEKAIDKGSTEALLLLAKVHLTYDPISWNSKQYPGFATLNEKSPPPSDRFIGSATIAAQLYERAIAKGSNAARINLAALYELGHGIDRDPGKAADLYRDALNSLFDGPAHLGLLRTSFQNLWEQETIRRKQILAADEQTKEVEKQDDIIIESRRDYLWIVVADPEGRRIFAGTLVRGQQYRPPHDRSDLILWPRYGMKANDVQIRIGPEIVELPNEMHAVGIRLDRTLLLNSKSFLVEGDLWAGEYPEEALKQSRISIEAIDQADVYVHSEGHLIGFQADLDHRPRLRVPSVHDLILELRPVGKINETKTSSIAIVVDGKPVIELSATSECLVTLRLDPDQMLGARLVSPAQDSCKSWNETDPPRAYIENVRGDPIGYIQKLPDENVPMVVSGSGLHLNEGIALLRLQIGGRWNEALRAASIFHKWSLHEFGPNSFDTIQRSLQVCEYEILLGNTGSARRRLDAVVDRLDRIGSVPPVTRIEFYERFGSLLNRVGRYAEAERFLLLAVASRERQNRLEGRPRAEHINLYTLSEVNEKLGHLDKAIMYELQSHLIGQVDDPERADTFNTEVSAGFLVGLLNLLHRTERDDQTPKLITFVHKEAKRDIARDLPEPLRFPLDLSAFEQTFGPVDRSANLADALAHLGEAYSWMDRHAEALPLFEQRAKTYRNIFGDASPQASAALASVATEHRLAGRSKEALGAAREAFTSALRYVTSRSSSQDSPRAAVDALRPAAFALLEALYESSPGGTNDLSLMQEAFEVAQRLQSSAAALALAAFGERLSQSESQLSALIRRRQDLKEELTRLDARLVATMSANSRFGDTAHGNEIREKIKQTEGLLQNLEATRPAKLRELDELAQIRSVPYHELVGLINSDEALITFVTGDDVTFAFVATPERLQWARINLGAHAIERMVATLRCGLDQKQWSGQDGRRRCGKATSSEPRAGVLPFDVSVAHELYQALFGTIEEFIAGKQLLVVPSGALTSLPPQVLVTGPVDGSVPTTLSKYRNTPWLARRHAITVLPSVGSLVSLRATSAPNHAPDPYIGFGDPVLSGNARCPAAAVVATDCPQSMKPTSVQVSGLGASGGIDPTQSYYRGALADINRIRQICPLPDTARELSCVAKTVAAGSSRIILGPDLTETAVKSTQLDRYRVIHFATHGLLADEIPNSDEPALVLTPPEAPTSEDDGLLTASEIAQLKLNADWVVLSACNTAGAEKVGAEALSGLARAFLYAGARTLLVSHWAVASSAAVLLTTRTFAEIAADRIGRAEALRQSMIAMMDDDSIPSFAHPQFWAPFVVLGEGGSINR